MILIDYDHSLLSLISSVLSHYGVPTEHKTLPELDSLLNNNYKNVVVMLFDGMGTAITEEHLPPYAFLRRNMCKTISSVFPPTTTAATTTMETGLSPIEHGWLGWSLYFDEVGANVNIFPNTLSGTEGISAADYHVARQYIPYKNVFEKITEATDGSVKAYAVSPFSDFHSGSVSEICHTIKKLCAEDGRKYIYSYWHQPDYDMHDFGTMDIKITKDITDINDLAEGMCQDLSDTLVIITADHGLVDTKWRFLTDYLDITECLEKAPSIESRALTFFVKDGMGNRFEVAFNEHFSDCYYLYTKKQVTNDKLFGNGTPHFRSYGFIGDYLAVAHSNVSIESTSSTEHDVFKAAHAGITDDEMNVPLIVVINS